MNEGQFKHSTAASFIRTTGSFYVDCHARKKALKPRFTVQYVF